MEKLEVRPHPTRPGIYQKRTVCGACSRVAERWRLTTSVPEAIYLFKPANCGNCGELLCEFTRSYKKVSRSYTPAESRPAQEPEWRDRGRTLPQ